MGRQAEHKPEQIIKCGLEIEKKVGKGKVTTSAIREYLGGGGSERIKNIWKQYTSERDEQEAFENSEAQIELPLELQSLFENQSSIVMKALRQFVIESYQTSDKLSEMKVKARIEEYSKQIDRLEDAENEALQAADKREDENFELLESNIALDSANQELKTKFFNSVQLRLHV